MKALIKRGNEEIKEMSFLNRDDFIAFIKKENGSSEIEYFHVSKTAVCLYDASAGNGHSKHNPCGYIERYNAISDKAYETSMLYGTVGFSGASPIDKSVLRDLTPEEEATVRGIFSKENQERLFEKWWNEK